MNKLKQFFLPEYMKKETYKPEPDRQIELIELMGYLVMCIGFVGASFGITVILAYLI